MKKEREIIIKVIENKRLNTNRLVEFFAIKYREKDIVKQNQKS